MQKKQQQQDVSQRWIQHQRQHNRTTQTWSCKYCADRKIFPSEPKLWEHAQLEHRNELASAQNKNIEVDLRRKFAEECALKRPTKDDSPARKPNSNVAQPEQPPAQGKRPLASAAPAPRPLPGIGALQIGAPQGSRDVEMQDRREDVQATTEQPRKRAAIGDGISAGSSSPFRDSSASPQPRRLKARPTSGPHGGSEKGMFDSRPKPGNKQLWSDDTTPLLKSSFLDPLNIASIQARRSRVPVLQPRPRKSFPAPTQISRNPQISQARPIVLGRDSSFLNLPTRAETYDMIMQPQTRPISQEQLVAEVKGIYAGLLMVEAKCIAIDNKHATLGQVDLTSQPKINNDQWSVFTPLGTEHALIALHRTLLHEHHDFFLASHHPSASPELRRLASRYGMPGRMWRNGIHSFLEVLRHRLPASLDHMLAFIYLAYCMMALLYETVPAFEETWIECLGDLARYRMAIEDDDLRARETWTGVAELWYSKASDKAPTTGRLYHHLAILARPNALQQLFYYAKSLCVAIPFTSARESILTLFEPVLRSDNAYRLPPLERAFVRAHGLLFTNRDIEKFDGAVKEFLDLLDNQIGRVTRKFMEQGYYIAAANSVAMLGFASTDNPVVQAMAGDPAGEADVEMAGNDSAAMKSFQRAKRFSNETLKIVLHRIGDPNVLPSIHVTLVFMYHMARHPRAMKLLEASFPWQSLTVMLNNLLAPYPTLARIESADFPLPVKDDVRPFPEDLAMRGLLWADGYYPEKWFSNDQIGGAENYLEVASMTDDRKERILWLACRLASLGDWIHYDGHSKRFSTSS